MLSNTLLEIKFSISDILKITIPGGFLSFITYSVYLINKQLNSLVETIHHLSKKVTILEKQNLDLKTLVQEKTIELQEIQGNMQNQLTLSSATQNVNVDALLANNAMTQFWIKAAGATLVGIFIIGGIYYVSGFSLSFKALLPKGLITFLQDTTPFFQTQKLYTFHDSVYNADWLVKIVNEKHVYLSVKPEFTPDFISVSNYIASLHSRAGTMTQLVSSGADVLAAPAPDAITATVVIANNLVSLL